MTRHQPRDKVRVTRLASILPTDDHSSQVFSPEYCARYDENRPGAVAEWLGRGLQSPYSGYVEESGESTQLHGKRACQS
jgi:hypothetical protein